MDLKQHIRDIPDFPKPGILFRDITTLLKNPEAMRETIARMSKICEGQGITKICGIESRGFIFGSTLADHLGVGFVPIRKAGKLPFKTISQEYSLEYGTDRIEVHVDAIEKGERIVIVDDLIATGGTAKAGAQLMQKLGADVFGFIFVIELAFLNGREVLGGHEIFSLVVYE